MGNSITLDCHPEAETLDMSNGLTEVLCSTMAMATALLATTPWQIRVARFWSEQDQSAPIIAGFGNAGFDLAELGFTETSWQEQRAFLLRSIAFARAAARWLVQETVHFGFLDWALAGLSDLVGLIDEAVVQRMVAARETDPKSARIDDEPLPSLVTADYGDSGPPPTPHPHCLLHGAYLHWRGCIACHSLGPHRDKRWRDRAVPVSLRPAPPWIQARVTPIPVRRHVRQTTRRSFEPHILASLRPKPGPWREAYDHVLAAFAADPFGLIAATGDRFAYELEARHYLAEWASGRPTSPAALLGSIVTTSFSSAPRFPGRLGLVLHHLERLDETLIGLLPRAEPPQAPPPIRTTLWPKTPDRAVLSRLAPPPPKKGSLSFTRAVVFPEVGEELLGFLRVDRDWMSYIHLGPLDASARIAIAIERPLEWAGIGFGDPLINYPGSGVNFGRQRFRLGDVSPWLDQSHLHLIVLGPQDTVLRVFQVPVGPEPSTSHYDDPSGAFQFLALRTGRIHGDTKAMVEVALGRPNLDTNPFARLRHLRSIKEAKRLAEAQVEARQDTRQDPPAIIVGLLTMIDTLLTEGRLVELAELPEWLIERLGPDILVQLVLTHAELRGGPNAETAALMLLWGLADPPSDPD